MNTPLLRQIFFMVTIAVAVVLAWQVGEQSYVLPALVGAGMVLVLALRVTRLQPDMLALGLVLVGYLVGNRGFAQLAPPGVPLLPGEAALGLGALMLLIRGTMAREIPVDLTPLSLSIVGFILGGTVRVLFDVGQFGFMAVRDYATVYYAGFFFMTVEAVRDPRGRKWLLGVLLLGFLVLIPVFWAFSEYLSFFIQSLVLHGIPLVYFKGDLAGTFLAVGALLLLYRPRRWPQWLRTGLAAISLAEAILVTSRAATLGYALSVIVLALGRQWRVVRFTVVCCVLGLIALFAEATLTDKPFEDSKLASLTEHMESLVDVAGTGRYDNPEAADTGDNNRFRLVWWRDVAEETWTDGRWFGLGFGHDLAARFVSDFYGVTVDDFSVRSPHSIIFTVFGRMGIVGMLLAGAVAVSGILAMLRTAKLAGEGVEGADLRLVFWACAASVGFSACFGVVLEGPMGAVPFWAFLGMAYAWPVAVDERAPRASLPGAPEPEERLLVSEVTGAA